MVELGEGQEENTKVTKTTPGHMPVGMRREGEKERVGGGGRERERERERERKKRGERDQ